jgi:hypothetical protein
MRGQLSRTVLRGLVGSNAHPATRLAGYEAREYLLEKWGRKCSYCHATTLPLQIEHIQCRAKGGTNRISNLCLACEPCNLKKGTQDITLFLAKKPDLLARILAQAKAPSRTRQQSIVPAASYMSTSKPWDCLSSVGLAGKQNATV